MAHSGNELLIMCNSNGEHIQNGPVLIPAHNWKIVVVVPEGAGSVLSRITPATRVIAVDIPNIEGIRSEPWNKYVVSVNQIEALTGYHFFIALAPGIASVLKAKVDGHGSDPVAYAKNRLNHRLRTINNNGFPRPLLD